MYLLPSKPCATYVTALIPPQRFFSSTMQNLSTQSMLLALGLGAKKTLAASAVINWLLKDGVGRIARMTVATNLCQSFDSDLKRIRFYTSVVFEATIGCEFITPFFPQHFLALASLANAGKAIALSAFVSTAVSERESRSPHSRSLQPSPLCA